jgi:hypothetical protein
VGDLAGAALSGYVVLSAARLGVPRAVLARMVANVGVDALIGTVPLLGDVADVGWRANTRNVALLERALADPVAVRRQSRLHVALVVLALALIAAAAITATALAVRWLWGVASGRGVEECPPDCRATARLPRSVATAGGFGG